MPARRALITGITGQDGAYLAKRLLDDGCEVIGTARRASSLNTWRMQELGVLDRIRIVPMELLEASNVASVIADVRPQEVYNLAAQSFVATSFAQPIYTTEVDGLGVLRLLEAIRTVDPSIRFYQASSSEMFGRVRESPQRESTPFYPRSPYATAKVYAHMTTVNYREAYGMNASCGILFNHESPLRGIEFVTRKITAAFAQIVAAGFGPVRLGNLEAKRDWGFAGDYADAMVRILRHDPPGDYVIATGEMRSVREFIEAAAEVAGFRLAWDGEHLGEMAIDRVSGRTIVKIDPAFFRPVEVAQLCGDASRAKVDLGWRPVTAFYKLVESMMKADMDRVSAGQMLM